MLNKISKKRLASGVKLGFNSTFASKKYEMKKSPLKKVSDKQAKLWKEAREECLRIWGHKCFLCGNDKGEIHIHHWQATRSQNPARKYDQTNLVPLCKKCHNHNGVDARFYELKEKIERKMNG